MADLSLPTLGYALIVVILVGVLLAQWRRRQGWVIALLLGTVLILFAFLTLDLPRVAGPLILLVPAGLSLLALGLSLPGSPPQPAPAGRGRRSVFFGGQRKETDKPSPWCPACGAELPADSPEGLCPRCLIETGMAQAEPSPSGSGVSTSAHGAAPASLSPADLARHFPHLEILELLGQGGMGAVYKARQVKLDRLVAVKILPPEWGKDPAFAERFAREARALARLNHPHIVAVHDFGEAGGLYYLVMEYVDGANLRQLLQEGRLAPDEALKIVPQICEALQYAHEEGIVHRDIKPENILLDRKGRVKIADFGLAKLIDRPRATFTLTGSQQVMGTLDYMAPEQRLRPLEVDHRADIYSLGVVFYEMLTGELPLGRFAPPSEKAPVDGRLDAIVFRALEREPERRYQRVSEVRTAVEALHGRPAYAAPAADVALAGRVDAATVQLETKGPAAALFVTGIAAFCYVTALAIGLLANARPGRGPFDGRPEVDWPFFCLGALGVYGLVALIFAGAVALARMKRYSLVLLATVLAMLPLGPHVLIGFFAGLWALYTLGRPGVKERFLENERRQRGILNPARELIAFEVKRPAVGLVVTGIAATVYVTILAAVILAGRRYGRGPFGGAPHLDWTFYFAAAVVVYGLIGTIFAGAAAMSRLVRYDLVMVAVMLGMLPLGPHALIGIPVGLWAFLVLRRPEVKAAFLQSFSGTGRAGRAVRGEEAESFAAAPTGPVLRKVRSFLHGFGTMFFSMRGRTAAPAESGILVGSGAAEGPARRHSSASAPGRRRGGLLLIAALPVLFALLVLVPAAFLTTESHSVQTAPWSSSSPYGYGPRGPMSSLPFGRWEGVQVDDRSNFFKQLQQLDKNQVERIDKLLRETDQKYLELELEHTTYHFEDDGTLRVFITPFARDLSVLETGFWRKFDAIVLDQARADAIRQQFSPYADVFGRGQTEIIIRPTRTGFNWSVYTSNNMGRTGTGSDSVTRLPKRLERFWEKLVLADQ